MRRPARPIARVGRDMAEFVRSEGLAHLIVVNVASTEPAVDASNLPTELGGDGETVGPWPSSVLCRPVRCMPLRRWRRAIRTSTSRPRSGSSPAAIDELARLRGTRHYGCDGKTGETLMKSVLAPMFARRNLQVMSWVGHNIFGNMDGQVLDDPANKQAKVASKDRLLGEILGYRPKTLISIEYMPDLGDWKTAWDHIHFAGFLGVPMTLQFIWQGCDSFLAAPLVLDLVRLTELAWRRGHVGSDALPVELFQEPVRRERASLRSAVRDVGAVGRRR